MKKIINIKKQAGFNLIEVLLAFLILSIGLLGVAGLQTTAVKASQTAMLKSIAITKVSEMIERIRANSAAAITDYELALGTVGIDKGCDTRSATILATQCSPADLASNDLYQWEQSLTNGGLPDNTDTDASIVIDDAAVPPIATITVYWKERGENMSYFSKIQQIPGAN
ncbi:MAG: type IV pilus modification protein PilV [Gammaproteobacteria bacterium]|nr:type IV pilus modification protein PilV [Gammaproteobacteria bacterium]